MLPSGNPLLYFRFKMRSLRDEIQRLQLEGDSIRPGEHPLIRAGVQRVRGDAELSEDDTCQVLSLKFNTAGVRKMN